MVNGCALGLVMPGRAGLSHVADRSHERRLRVSQGLTDGSTRQSLCIDQRGLHRVSRILDGGKGVWAGQPARRLTAARMGAG